MTSRSTSIQVELDPGETVGALTTLFTNEVGGRAVVIAADRLGDGDRWLLVLAFVVGGGAMTLVGHVICPMPTFWSDVMDHSPRINWLRTMSNLLAPDP